jgi:hypothetical protein
MPVVRNAAHALAALSVKEAIPDLVGCLEEAPPDAPFTVPGEDGKRKVMVRELVRVNHHRNCLLCHAPLADDLDVRRSPEFPIGPVPSAQEPLPPSLSPVYYSQRSGVTLVRADITYLRQDFSLQQEVAEPGKWSSVQRFDFLVRTRELTPKEIEERTPVIVLEYRDTIAEALRHLSGKDLPPIAASWRAALDMPAAKMSAK